jgi:hypothetical protein
MTFKLSATDTLVWAIDLTTQSPVRSRSLYDENGTRWRRTDGGDLCCQRLPGKSLWRRLCRDRQPGEGIVWTGAVMDDGREPYDWSLSDLRPPRQQHLYTDRPTVRADDVLQRVVRQAYGRYRLPDDSVRSAMQAFRDRDGNDRPGAVRFRHRARAIHLVMLSSYYTYRWWIAIESPSHSTWPTTASRRSTAGGLWDRNRDSVRRDAVCYRERATSSAPAENCRSSGRCMARSFFDLPTTR